MLSEQEVSNSWRKLFRVGQISGDTLIKAEALIDELRPESPLRHRLGLELQEVRRLQDVADAV